MTGLVACVLWHNLRSYEIFFAKKCPKMFVVQKKFVRSYLCNRKTERDSKFGLWCNGNTTDSGPVIPGSNPGSPTDEKKGKLLKKSSFPFSFPAISLVVKGIFPIFVLVNHRNTHLNKTDMKIRQFLATLLLVVGATALGGCSDEDDPYYHSVPGGGFAYRAN